MDHLTPFHLAIAVTDLVQARAFYGDLLGCPEGRSTERWVDFNLFGHQLVCHLVEGETDTPARRVSNSVDGEAVPVPHFGVVLEMPVWQTLEAHLRSQGVSFIIEPTIRFAGQVGEQAILFLQDPSGNLLEFKAFADIDRQLFAH